MLNTRYKTAQNTNYFLNYYYITHFPPKNVLNIQYLVSEETLGSRLEFKMNSCGFEHYLPAQREIDWPTGGPAA